LDRSVDASAEGQPEHVSAAQLTAHIATTSNTLVVHAPFSDPAAQTLIVRRNESGEVELHVTTNDIMIARHGAAKIILGGRIEGGAETARNEFRGGRIIGGHTQSLSPGDVLWIPAGVPH